MQIGINYSFYRYRFDEPSFYRSGSRADIDRQSVRAQLNFWAPIVNKARR